MRKRLLTTGEPAPWFSAPTSANPNFFSTRWPVDTSCCRSSSRPLGPTVAGFWMTCGKLVRGSATTQ